MPNLYARATALSNIAGRIDYVASHHRQEHLLATYDGAAELLDGQFWRQLANECQTAFEQSGKKTRTVRMKDGTLKTKKLKCCQGRELVLQLSNSLLDRMTPQQIAKAIADELREKEGMVCLVAVHFNKDGTNLHAHVIFPERQLLEKPVIKTADRNLFFDATGKRCYKKAEILDANKQLLPGCRIVKKGEVYEQRCFSPADEKFSRKAWLRHLKTDVILPLRNGKLRGDVEITEYDKRTGKLAQQHVGNKIRDPKIRAQIKAYNEGVKAYNAMVDAGHITATELRTVQTSIRRSRNRNELLPTVTANVRKKQDERILRARRDWKVQQMVDSVRIARELGAGNITELEDKKEDLGRDLGRAKRKYATTVQQYGEGSLEAKMAKAELIKAKNTYATAMRTIENSRSHRFDAPPTDPDDR